MDIEELREVRISLPDRDSIKLIQLTEQNLEDIVKLLGNNFIEYSYIKKKTGKIIGEKEVFELQFLTTYNNNIRIETITFGNWIMIMNSLENSKSEIFKTELYFPHYVFLKDIHLK